MTAKNDLKQRFEMTCNITTAVVEDPSLEGMVATIRSYRDFITKNLERAGPIDGRTFADWMDSATRDPDDFPEPWVGEMVEVFDGILSSAAREENIPPGVIAEALDEWVEESTAEVKHIHGFPEAFFMSEADGGESDNRRNSDR